MTAGVSQVGYGGRYKQAAGAMVGNANDNDEVPCLSYCGQLQVAQTDLANRVPRLNTTMAKVSSKTTESNTIGMVQPIYAGRLANL